VVMWMRNTGNGYTEHSPEPSAFSYRLRLMAAAFIGLLLISIVAGGIGSVYIPPEDVLRIFLSRFIETDLIRSARDGWDVIIWQIRFPRIVLCVLVGGSLAISGATFQGLFRNPLADPYLIGVASGAGLGATVILVTGIPLIYLGISLLPVAAFVGGLGATIAAYYVARRSGGVPLTTLILAGVAIGSLAGSVTSLLIIRADPSVKPLLSWLLGGFSGTGWSDVQIILPFLLVGVTGMLCYSRVLNVLQLHDDEAATMGVNVERTKVILIVLASLTTASAVSVSGLIGFVGLIAPHAVRLLWGYDYRLLLPMSMLVGGGFLVLADLLARTIVNPAEIPVGVVTAFCGAPFFLYLLIRDRRLV
jgi:iron complex transport system permease protein